MIGIPHMGWGSNKPNRSALWRDGQAEYISQGHHQWPCLSTHIYGTSISSVYLHFLGNQTMLHANYEWYSWLPPLSLHSLDDDHEQWGNICFQYSDFAVNI